MKKILFAVFCLFCAFLYITKGAREATAFFPRNSGAGIVGAASVAISSVQAGGGGGGGGSGLTFKYNSGKFRQNGGTTLVVTAPTAMITTNTTVLLGILTGDTTVAHVISQGNKYWTLLSSRALQGTTGCVYKYDSTATFQIWSATITQPASQTIVAGFIASSNTVGTVSVDVSSNSSGTGTVVHLGTTTASAATTGICMSIFGDNSGVNDSKTWRAPYQLVASETDGTSFITGSIGFSTGSATFPINSAVQNGNCNLQASKTWTSMSVCAKTP